MVADWIIASVLTVVVALIAGWKYYAKFKTKLSSVTAFLVEVDKAVYDDKITEEEFRGIFEKFKKVITDP